MSNQLHLTDEASHSQDEYDPGMRNPVADIFAVQRPWGDFQQFVSNETVTVKVITVQPGHRLSLQRHEHRGEMWQVLDGPIDVTVDDRQWRAERGEVVWVPRGATHRMGNSGSEPGRLLEVGFGHFDEADIERLEDDYSRQH
jgi:mannose-6-phosphate isomerase